jgi:glycopeptide antibiotics resistance protein
MGVKDNSRSGQPGNIGANKFTIILFVKYLLALCWILLFKLGVQFSYMEARRVSLTPFREYVLYGKMDLPEIIMNVIIFIPLGIYTAVLWSRWFFAKCLLFFFVFSLVVEAVQYIFRIGAFDITDIINNTLGGIIGYILFKGIEKIFSDRVKAQKLINIIGAAGTIFMIIMLVLLKTNRLGIRYQ